MRIIVILKNTKIQRKLQVSVNYLRYVNSNVHFNIYECPKHRAPFALSIDSISHHETAWVKYTLIVSYAVLLRNKAGIMIWFQPNNVLWSKMSYVILTYIINQ